MTREMVTRAFGWKSLATAGISLLTILAGALAARQRRRTGIPCEAIPASVSC